MGLSRSPLLPMTREESFTFKVLVKMEDRLWVAHCLELDIVATADTRDQVEKDIVDLIAAQVCYALDHDNLEYLYRSAPPDVWNEFLECKECRESRHLVTVASEGGTLSGEIRPLIITNTCLPESAYHAQGPS